MKRGKKSIVQSGDIKLHSYFKKTGLTAFSVAKAPLLNLMIPKPLDIPPSGKIIISGFPDSKTSFYLSPMNSTTLSLASLSPSLGINTQSTALKMSPINGASANAAFGQKLGSKHK